MAQEGFWRGGVEMKEDAMFFVRKVHDTFKRDMEQGYVTKDKQFAVDLLGQALKAESVEHQSDSPAALDARTLEAAAKVADQYTRVSPLHNYGPQGVSRAEKEAMQTARFIAEDIRSLTQEGGR
jgi:hypothetical protein